MFSSAAKVHSPSPSPTLSDVLIVESQLSTRKALERLLESLNLGLHYRSVSSAAQAQQEVRDARPDLVLSGLTLPDLSGLELCRRLQKDALTVVLLGEVQRAEAEAAGAAGMLGLPLEQCELSRLLETLFAAPSRAQGEVAAAPTLAKVLILKLLERPGVMAISAYDQGGQLIEEAGEALPPELGRRASSYLQATRWLNKSGASVPAALCTIQVEYGSRCLLLFEQPSGVIACLLRDSASATLMKYWLRSAR